VQARSLALIKPTTAAISWVNTFSYTIVLVLRLTLEI
jgi:hypothetical protein